MPELPEVETVRQQLAKDVVGRKVKEVAVTNGKSVRRHKTPKAFRDLLDDRVQGFKPPAHYMDVDF